MDASSESPTYEIKSIVEQKPFYYQSATNVLEKWCEVNDSITPKFIKREEWKQKTEILSDKDPNNGKHNLYIPFDISLWEMVAVMEAVDNDTFKDQPEKQDLAKKEIEELGKTIKNAGVYIAKRLDSITKGREIASAMAEEFYGYGKALVERKKEETPSLAEIAAENLTEEEAEAVDMFLAGEDLYKSRMQRVKDGDVEAERRKALAQFFAISERAFELKRKGFDGEAKDNREGLRPWQDNTPFYNAFIKKVEESINREVEKPKREITDSIFRRGMETLGKNMPFDKLPVWVKDIFLNLRGGETTLREALHIDRLKADLENTRYFGSVEEISVKEKSIADEIQLIVSRYKYDEDMDNPSKMINTQTLNCVGASILGGALMQEAGLNYLVGNVPGHSLLFLVTADGKVEWRDMLNTRLNEELADEIIEGEKGDGTPISVADIVAFSQNSKPEGLMFDIKGTFYRDRTGLEKEGPRQYITVFGPEYGQKIQILNNLGISLINSRHYFEALDVLQQATALGSRESCYYFSLGVALAEAGRKDEAIEVYRKAIAINPKDGDTFYNLGIVLEDVGRKDEAVEAYQKYIELADRDNDRECIDYASVSIAELQKK